MRCDYPVHTHFSDYLMEDVVKDAIHLSLDEICFMDHVDYPLYFKEISRLKEKYNH